MLAIMVILGVSIIGVLATGVSFYALYVGPRKSQLAALILASAVLVGSSPFITLFLGTNGHSWLRGLMAFGLAPFFTGAAVFLVTLLFSKRWTVLVSAIPMAALIGWSFFFLAIFGSGVV